MASLALSQIKVGKFGKFDSELLHAPLHNHKGSFLADFPLDISLLVFSFLDVSSLLKLSECSHYFSEITSICAIWSEKCRRLWNDKVYVCKEAKSLLVCVNSSMGKNNLARNDIFSSIWCCKAAYRISILDGKYRQFITESELCTFIWSFRFKKSAGNTWISTDPWWNHEEPRKFMFLENGRVLQVMEDDKEFLVPTEQSRKRKRTLYYNSILYHNKSSELLYKTLLKQTNMKWRFVTSPLDLPSAEIGSYLRITIDGREVPTYVVGRSTNWGFMMENCWGVFSSFALPKKGTIHDVGDESMVSTHLSQWKEALLYNLGSNILPEGQLAMNISDYT